MKGKLSALRRWLKLTMRSAPVATSVEPPDQLTLENALSCQTAPTANVLEIAGVETFCCKGLPALLLAK